MAVDPLSLSAFEERAAAAEARLAVLEAKFSGSSSSVPVTLVSDLEELKALLTKAKQETEQLTKQRDEALKAKSLLEVENSKLQYRVKHLVKAVREGDEKLAAVQAKA